VNVSYTVTFADYKAALRLHRRQKLSRRLSFVLWFIAVPVIATIGLIIFLIFDLSKVMHYASVLFGIECGLIWISLFLPVWALYSTRKCYKQIFQASGKKRTIELDVTDESVRSVVPGVNEGKFFWNENMAFVADDRVILVYVAKKRFILIPSSFLSQAQVKELQATISRNKVGR